MFTALLLAYVLIHGSLTWKSFSRYVDFNWDMTIDGHDLEDAKGDDYGCGFFLI